MKASRIGALRSFATALRLAVRPGGPSLGDRLRALPRLSSAVARGHYTGATTSRLLLMVAALGYVLTPLDLMPEAVLGIVGLFDDAFVASWLVAAIVTETEDFLSWERGVATGATGAGATGPTSASAAQPTGGAAPQFVKSTILR